MNGKAGGLKKADVVVIGSGAAGMAAALTAAESGAKVIVFEKLHHPGGTSNFAQGLFAVESDMQRQRYIGITRDEAFKTVMNYSHWRANPYLVRTVIDKSAESPPRQLTGSRNRALSSLSL